MAIEDVPAVLRMSGESGIGQQLSGMLALKKTGHDIAPPRLQMMQQRGCLFGSLQPAKPRIDIPLRSFHFVHLTDDVRHRCAQSASVSRVLCQ